MGKIITEKNHHEFYEVTSNLSWSIFFICEDELEHVGFKIVPIQLLLFLFWW